MAVTTPDNARDPLAPLDDLDTTILAGVRQYWESHDPIPPALVEHIQFAIDLNAADLEVSRLVGMEQLAAARADEHTRLVTFQSDSLTVMITIDPRRDGSIRIDGWLTPQASHRIELRIGPSTLSTNSDGNGRFALDAVPAGIMQLIVHLDGTSRRIITPSIAI